MVAYNTKGSVANYKPDETRRDVRRFTTKFHSELMSEDGATYLLIIVVCLCGIGFFLPFGNEIALMVTLVLSSVYMHPKQRLYNFPWRVPIHAKLMDGSRNLELANDISKGNAKKIKPELLHGEGVTYFGRCRLTQLPVYATNSDMRTHLLVLGTTGSGKTEFLLGMVANQLIQNSGLIFVDAKGDPALQRDMSRLARRFGRDDDILTINFITSGRDLVKAQSDKITNTFNMMSNTSSGMLIELLNNLLDDSGGGGGDMWKGRAMTFIAAVTRALTYLRDGGYIQLSPSIYIEFMELSALEEIVFNHNGKYGEFFDVVASPLRSYIVTLPGYNSNPKARKKQEQKTLEQHGFITMQLTRAINSLTYDYGHIFGVRQGDIDIFDCVLNRRILTVPLPALERAPDSLKMLGKLIIGSVKQMMAGSLGNRIEGLVREILDSRPTNSPNAYALILDEFGYIIVSGTSVMPAQGRSLSFSILFAAQDFSDIKRGNENEAEAIWGNSNVKVIGRIVTGDSGATMDKVNGFTGEEWQARSSTTERKVGDISDSFTPSNQIQFQKERRLPFEDLAGQENGEFTLLISKKEDGGAQAGVRIVRTNSFYVAGKALKYLRMNDLSPIITIEKEDIPDPTARLQKLESCLKDDTTRNRIGSAALSSDNESMNALISIIKIAKDSAEYQPHPIDSLLYALSSSPHIKGSSDYDVATADDVFESQADEIKEFLKNKATIFTRQSLETTDSKREIELERMLVDNNDLPSRTIQNQAFENISRDVAVQSVDINSPLAEAVYGTPLNVFTLSSFFDVIKNRLESVDLEAFDSASSYDLFPCPPLESINTETQSKSTIIWDGEQITLAAKPVKHSAYIHGDKVEESIEEQIAQTEQHVHKASVSLTSNMQTALMSIQGALTAVERNTEFNYSEEIQAKTVADSRSEIQRVITLVNKAKEGFVIRDSE